MINITAKFLGGTRQDVGIASATAAFPAGASLTDLEGWLRTLGVDPDGPDIIITLDGHGLRQLPENFYLEKDHVVAVFPVITGGKM